VHNATVTTLYEYPEYYDILFGWDRDAEAQTYDTALVAHGTPSGGRLLEVAAGTSQIGVRLARIGWSVTALDASDAMLAFATERAERVGVRLATLTADMRSFASADKFDGAINPMSSFRLLLEDAEVDDHLNCMAGALAPSGVYLIDITFGSDGTAESDLDEWVMHRDGITVTATTREVRVVDTPRRLAVTLDWHESLRSYTRESFAASIARCEGLRILGCYPEVGTGNDDVSRFGSLVEHDLPGAGRAIVVLCAPDRRRWG